MRSPIVGHGLYRSQPLFSAHAVMRPDSARPLTTTTATRESHVSRRRAGCTTPSVVAERLRAASERLHASYERLQPDIEAGQTDIEAAHVGYETPQPDVEAGHADFETLQPDNEAEHVLAATRPSHPAGGRPRPARGVDGASGVSPRWPVYRVPGSGRGSEGAAARARTPSPSAISRATSPTVPSEITQPSAVPTPSESAR